MTAGDDATALPTSDPTTAATPDPTAGPADATALFAAHRSLLFTVAYEMLGSAADAEDVVQEVWLRWAARYGGRDKPDLTTTVAGTDVGEAEPGAVADAVDTTAAGEPIRHPRAYLVRIATRLSLNRMRTLARQREDYIGPWLPEPLLTVPDVIDGVVLTESVSMAMLVVLESLGPPERAVFVLREVFGYDYDEIAAAVDRTPAAVRQIAHRAREHVQARRPRFAPDPKTVEAVMTGFAQTLFTGDIQALMNLMAPDVVLLSDGGGKRQAARRPVLGADNVARFLFGVLGKTTGEMRLEVVAINGAPGWALYLDGELDSVAQLVLNGAAIEQVLFLRNPDKLAGLVRTPPRPL